MAKKRNYELSDIQNAYIQKLLNQTESNGFDSKPNAYWERMVLNQAGEGALRIKKECEYWSEQLKREDLTTFEVELFSREKDSCLRYFTHCEDISINKLISEANKEFEDINDVRSRHKRQEVVVGEVFKDLETLSEIPFQTGGEK